MKTLTLPKNIGYYIAGIGAVIALFAFFFISFATEVITYNMPTANPASTDKSVFAAQFIPKSSEWTVTSTGNTTALGQINGVIWVAAFLTVLIIIGAALLAFRSNSPFGLKNVATAKQVLWGSYALVGLAVLSILIQIGVFANATQILQGSISTTPGSQFSIGELHQAVVQFDAGAWIFLLCMLAVIVGVGIPLLGQLPAQLAALRTRSSQSARATASQPYPPAQQYPTAQQYPPTRPYPTQDQSLPAQHYPAAAEQQYPVSEQYPPTVPPYGGQEQYPPAQAYPAPDQYHQPYSDAGQDVPTGPGANVPQSQPPEPPQQSF